MDVYTILIKSDEHGVELLPHYFNTYAAALAAVKKKYNGEEDELGNYFPNWADEGNTVTHAEAHNSDGTLASDLNLTKLYIEKGNHISIHKLILCREEISPCAGGGNTRRRHRKRNTKNSRKRKFKKLSRFY